MCVRARVPSGSHILSGEKWLIQDSVPSRLSTWAHASITVRHLWVGNQIQYDGDGDDDDSLRL